MRLIAAVDKAWAIGYRGDTLVEIPADRKWFWQETKGKLVVMGRKTLESLPGGRLLPGRINIVLSRDPRFAAKGAVLCHSLGEALKRCAGYPPEDVWIIGGQQIYQAFLPYCDVAHVTFIDHAYHADTYFPDLSADPEWELAAESEEQTYSDLCYTFRMYRRRTAPMPLPVDAK